MTQSRCQKALLPLLAGFPHPSGRKRRVHYFVFYVVDDCSWSVLKRYDKQPCTNSIKLIHQRILFLVITMGNNNVINWFDINYTFLINNYYGNNVIYWFIIDDM